jgi:hypothetical protein
MKIPDEYIENLIRLAYIANEQMKVDSEAVSIKTIIALEDLIGEVLALNKIV